METCVLAARSHWCWFLFNICEQRSCFHEEIAKLSVIGWIASQDFSVTLQNRLFPASGPGALRPSSACSGGSSDNTGKGHRGGCLRPWLTSFLGCFMCTCKSGITPSMACLIHVVGDISPSLIQIFKQLHLDISSFCTFLFCKVIITLYELAQAFISGNILLAVFLSPPCTLSFNDLKGLYFNTAFHKRD